MGESAGELPVMVSVKARVRVSVRVGVIMKEIWG